MIGYTIHTETNTLSANHVQTDPSNTNNRTRGSTATFDLSVTESTLDTLLAYDRHAGSYALQGTNKNTQRYKERLPSGANINSLVIGLEPDTELQNDDIVGKWGLISDVADSRSQALTNPVATIEIDVLADYSEYADVTAVQNDLEI
jgi:hypothetical protein